MGRDQSQRYPIYVTNENSNTVSVINTATNAVTANVPGRRRQ